MTDTQRICTLLWIAANTHLKNVHDYLSAAANVLWRSMDEEVLKLRARHHAKLADAKWAGHLWSIEVDTPLGWSYVEPMDTPTRQHALNALGAYASAAHLAGIPVAVTRPTEPEICECCGQTIAEVAS